jgi:hypothetical protein
VTDAVLEPAAAAVRAALRAGQRRLRPLCAGLLVAIYTVNFLDRQIITTVGEAIKDDLHLTDTQMGALGGIFFAVVYTILGIPIARVADKPTGPG